MASILVCDHCGKPIDRGEVVRVSVTLPMAAFKSTGKGSLAERAKAAGDDAATLARRASGDRNWDLHWDCYDRQIGGVLEAAIGAPS